MVLCGWGAEPTRSVGQRRTPPISATWEVTPFTACTLQSLARTRMQSRRPRSGHRDHILPRCLVIATGPLLAPSTRTSPRLRPPSPEPAPSVLFLFHASSATSSSSPSAETRRPLMCSTTSGTRLSSKARSLLVQRPPVSPGQDTTSRRIRDGPPSYLPTRVTVFRFWSIRG